MFVSVFVCACVYCVVQYREYVYMDSADFQILPARDTHGIHIFKATLTPRGPNCILKQDTAKSPSSST